MFVLRTLGRLDVRSADDAVLHSILSQPKRAALLCYLAAGRPGIHSRDSLVAMFWSEFDHERARNALSQALSFLRRSLHHDAILNRNSDEVAVNRELIRCDVVDLEHSLERGLLETAVASYQGEFLQGFHVSDAPAFERWIDEERVRLRERVAKAAEKLTSAALASGDRNAAIECAHRCYALTPYDEKRARVLFDLFIETGQAAAAIAFYEAFAQRLRSDLELKPSAEWLAKLQRIRARPPASMAATPPKPLTSTTTATPSAADVPQQLVNELAPGLEVLRLLGRGSTAIACLAREPALKRLVTVKVLRKQLAVDRIARLRFEREAQAAARISHTNVATVYHVGRLSDDVPYIVMEYVDGRTLADTLAARGPLRQDEALGLLAALASALAAAHQQGVIHRDVRPKNIYMENRGARVVLTDFGIAALLESGAEYPVPLTPAGTRLGEMRYASPEQTRGEQVNELTDVYSFGIVAMEVLTGKHPTDGAAIQVATGNGLSAAQSLMSGNAITDDVMRIAERCLSEDPDRRPRAQDVTAMLARIQ